MDEELNNQNSSSESVQNSNVEPGETPLELHIARIKENWIQTINEMNQKFINIKDLRDLMGTLYSQRQIALEYHNKLLNKIATLNKIYRQKSAERYNFYRMDARLSYKSESAINIQIMADLSGMKYNIDIMTEFADYIEGTIKTIDDMIYAIPNRIRLEELILGVK